MPRHPVPDSIPISALNALEYCSRRFYYQFVQGVTLVNEYVLEGALTHKRVHQQATHVTREGELQTTRLYLSCATLRRAGFSGVCEEQGGTSIQVDYNSAQQL